uniref:Uncharacterized protein n=1 Tax=Anopheles culicifacies TaxID=139723 RepID=A0A182MEZ3_9DIPT
MLIDVYRNANHRDGVVRCFLRAHKPAVGNERFKAWLGEYIILRQPWTYHHIRTRLSRKLIIIKLPQNLVPIANSTTPFGAFATNVCSSGGKGCGSMICSPPTGITFGGMVSGGSRAGLELIGQWKVERLLGNACQMWQEDKPTVQSIKQMDKGVVLIVAIVVVALLVVVTVGSMVVAVPRNIPTGPPSPSSSTVRGAVRSSSTSDAGPGTSGLEAVS